MPNSIDFWRYRNASSWRRGRDYEKFQTLNNLRIQQFSLAIIDTVKQVLYI
ncbi:hypothetical protein [Microcella alkaliphila]|uniref:Transcriptional regulator ATRX n=1 Tax=Microcella alkaliphila TaxID=279828 RepID=A0A0U5BNC9_9MICO|nr:hypothetical protein [Microcella alkaliphila]BAU32363.1 transcriptional regulator ATRX [Microcella alkaliphila]